MERTVRIDHNVIVRLIPEGSSVLDLGCGDGSLLKKLKDEKGIQGKGIEISEIGVKQCISKGLTVLQGDIDEGLRDYPDKSFDYVVLNQTLQVVKKPDLVLSEMLRVGKRGIVGFPNFAYWKIRLYLLFEGRMPKTRFLPYEWYNTPNIHLCSVKDFEIYCAEHGISIERRIYISTERGGRILRGVMPNLFAENAIYVIRKNG
ncbi:MAG: methionine biosynthesis protein MetW [Deltaproteobacteria bacterium]|nr:MAG: methionine biosynthesis protein MetW [Deltaproteobacteria bacterium]